VIARKRTAVLGIDELPKELQRGTKVRGKALKKENGARRQKHASAALAWAAASNRELAACNWVPNM
jgi:hypothetical protein